MKVTRDVIYDLLPGYFAGDVTPDTRALVDEFLRDDPEFAHMMQRFRAVFEARPQADPVSSSAREQQAFDRARGLLHKRSELRGIMGAFGFAAILVTLAWVFAGKPLGIQYWTITGAFVITSLVAGVQLEFLYRDHPELRGRRDRLRDV